MAGPYAVNTPSDRLLHSVRHYLLDYWTVKHGRNFLRTDHSFGAKTALIQVVIAAGTLVDVAHVIETIHVLEELLVGSAQLRCTQDTLRLEYTIRLDMPDDYVCSDFTLSTPATAAAAADALDGSVALRQNAKRSRFASALETINTNV